MEFESINEAVKIYHACDISLVTMLLLMTTGIFTFVGAGLAFDRRTVEMSVFFTASAFAVLLFSSLHLTNNRKTDRQIAARKYFRNPMNYKEKTCFKGVARAISGQTFATLNDAEKSKEYSYDYVMIVKNNKDYNIYYNERTKGFSKNFMLPTRKGYLFSNHREAGCPSELAKKVALRKSELELIVFN
jgi:hypothetical protein